MPTPVHTRLDFDEGPEKFIVYVKSPYLTGQLQSISYVT